MFLSYLYVFTPFINPIVPILTKSSKSTFVFSYFFAKNTTNLKLCSINLSLASLLPSNINSVSSSLDKGSGNLSKLPTKYTFLINIFFINNFVNELIC